MFQPPPGGGRAVPITYLLRNPDTSFASISAEWSADAGSTFHAATAAPGGEGTSGLDASPAGTAHVFLWNALEDLGPGRHLVLFRITPYLDGHLGTIGMAGGFLVDNTDLFVRAGDLFRSRQASAAVATPEGGALVAGGAGFASETEAFLPDRHAFELRDGLLPPRDGCGAETLIDTDGNEPEPRPFLAGGLGAAGALDRVEIYDSGEDRWLAAVTLTSARAEPTVTRLADGRRALIAGGKDASGKPIGAADEIVTLSIPTPAAVPVNLESRRFGHTATLLPDGRVFLVGGTDAAGVTATTLVFDPDANQGAGASAPGPPLIEPRTGHAAALLGGKLIVFGGSGPSGAALESAEIVDAALGPGATFDLTRDSSGNPATMRSARTRLTATSLGDSEVVLIGGSDGAHDLASAERFVLSTGIFEATRDGLLFARSGHCATPIGAGRILVTGGGHASAEVYFAASRSASGSFDPVAAGTQGGRAEHEVTALADGRALVTGGTDGVIEGGHPRALATAELFSPFAKAPEPALAPLAATMTAGRRRHTATLLASGSVLIVGGLDAHAAPLASAELFDPATGTFSPLSVSLPVGLFDHTATPIEGGTKVLIAGGRTAGGLPSAAAYLFEEAAPGFVALGPMGEARARHSATLLADGRVLVAGGITAADSPTATAEVFDPTSFRFAPCANTLGVARFDHTALLLTDGRVLVAGGRPAFGAAPTGDVRIFEAATLTFSKLAEIYPARAEHCACALSGARALFAGGITGAAPAGASDLASPVTSGASIYDPAANGGAGGESPVADPDLACGRRGLKAAALSDGTFLLVGGRREAGATVAGSERFRP